MALNLAKVLQKKKKTLEHVVKYRAYERWTEQINGKVNQNVVDICVFRFK